MKKFANTFIPAFMCTALAISGCKKPESENTAEKPLETEQVQAWTTEKIANIVSETIDASGRKKEDMVNTVSAALSESEKELEKTLKQIEEAPVITQINEVKDAWQNISNTSESEEISENEDASAPENSLPRYAE